MLWASGLSCEAAPDGCVVVLLEQIMTLTMVLESFMINAAAAFVPLIIEVTCLLAGLLGLAMLTGCHCQCLTWQ
jgi:hypothetical protein